MQNYPDLKRQPSISLNLRDYFATADNHLKSAYLTLQAPRKTHKRLPTSIETRNERDAKAMSEPNFGQRFEAVQALNRLSSSLYSGKPTIRLNSSKVIISP